MHLFIYTTLFLLHEHERRAKLPVCFGFVDGDLSVFEL